MPFDIETAIPIEEKPAQDGQQPGLVRKPGFDIETADSVTVDEKGMTAYDHFIAGQLDAQVKAAIHQPLDEGQARFIQDSEKTDPGAFRSFAVPYTEGIVGFFTKPFGYRPDLSRPFGLTKGPKGQGEQAQDQLMAEQHPIATTLGQIVAGTAPFIATAPLFPQSLLGTLATFETVGLTQKFGEIATDESLMTPLGQKGAELGIEAVKSGIMAPIWHYSRALKFIGRPFLSAVTRAGVRGAGQATLSTVFGTDLAQALKEGGTITALSLIFEAPALAKTALGRGIINRANEIAAAKGLGEGRFTINVDKLDEASTRQSLFNMIRGFYNLMRYPIEKVQAEAAPGAGPDPYARFLAAPSTPETPGQAIAPIVTLVPPGGGQPSAGGMAYRTEKQPIFYSKMMATLAEKMPEIATPEQVQGIIKGTGISPDEIDMSNLGDFLKGKGKVSKPELLDYLKQNQVQIEEIIKGGEAASPQAYTRRMDEISSRLNTLGFKIEADPNGMPGEVSVNDMQNNYIDPEELASKNREAAVLADEFSTLSRQILEGGGGPIGTKYSQYILPGGDNYKEVLFKAPVMQAGKTGYYVINNPERGELVAYDSKTGKEIAAEPHEEALKSVLKKKGYPDIQRISPYISPHWDEPNVLAHVRMTDRITSDGKKVLFIEEIQSDWAREGREKGFLTENRDKLEQRRQDIELKGKEATQAEKQEWADIKNKLQAIRNAIPGHPLLKHWQPLILKHLLRYAAENGYDYISWTTGEQQAERYDLSKQIDSLEYYKQGKNYKIFGTKNDDTVIEQIVSDDKLDALVGKEIGKRIRKGEGKSTESEFGKGGVLEGTNLQIGGEWAKNLYDQQIPNWLNDYLKKLDVNVEAIRISGGKPELTIRQVGNDFNVMDQGKVLFQGSEEEAQTYIESYNAGYGAGQTESIQQAVPITSELKQALVYAGQPILGKMPAEIGQPGAPTKTWKFIFRLSENAEVINTKGEKVTLPKGEEYHTLNVLDKDENIVPGKVRLQDGKQITIYEGELNKLKGYLLPSGEGPMAGGLTHPPAPAENQPPEGEQPNEDELRAAWEVEVDREAQARKDELKDFLSGKLKYELKGKGEYEDLKHLSWLWAKQGERGYTPDELTELSGMGFDVGDPAESGFDDRVIELIKSYFNEDIQAKAADAVARADKAARQDKIRINESLMKKYHRDLAKALHIRAIEAAKMVAKIEKILSKPLARSKIKQIIRENTGIIKISDVIGEDEALRRLMQREQAVSKEAFRAGKETGQEELRAHQAEIKARKETKEAASEEVRGIIKDIREIGDHLGVLPVDYQDAVKEILNQYDIPEQAFKRSTKTLAVRDARRRYIQEMEESGEEVNIPEDELDLLEKITPNEMTVDDLRRVHLTLKRLYYQGKIKNKLISAMEARDFEEVKEEGIDTITKQQGIEETETFLEELKKQNKNLINKKKEDLRDYINQNLRPELMINMLDGYDQGINTKILWGTNWEAEKRELIQKDVSLGAIIAIHHKVDIARAYSKKYDVGRFKGVTKANVMTIYALTFNEAGSRRLEGSGLSEDDIQALTAILTTEEKQAVEEMIKFYDTIQYPSIDEVYTKLEGVHLPKEEGYFPMPRTEDISYNKELEAEIMERHYLRRAGTEKGFTKKRSMTSKGVSDFDYFGIIIRNWQQIEHYKAFAAAIRDTNKYLNHSEIKAAIKQVHGDKFYNVLSKWLKDVAYGGDKQTLDFINNLSRWLRTNYAISVLGFNFLSMLKQPVSFLQGMQMGGKGETLKATLEFMMHPKRMIAEAKEKSPLIKFRFFSQERELREIKGRRNVQQRLKNISGYQWLREKSMLPIQGADFVTVVIVWHGAYNEAIADGATEGEAIETADRVLRRTQPMGGIIHLPEAFRASEIQKMFTLFRNQPNQNFNLIFESIGQKKEGKTGWGKFTFDQLFYLIIPAFLIGLISRKRMQESLDEFARDILNSSLGGLVFVGGIVYSLTSGFNQASTPIDSLMQDIVGMAKGKHLITKVNKIVNIISKSTGIPIVGIRRLFAGQLLGKPAKNQTGNFSGPRGIYQ